MSLGKISVFYMEVREDFLLLSRTRRMGEYRNACRVLGEKIKDH
jgi:hypothetical protein